ncbi:MAG: rhomboid family intramembrane serine protease, partial [Pseudomonadales bacterium]
MIQRERPSVKQSIKWVLAICFVITVIQIVNVLSNYSLNRFALIPRHSDGLLGILTSPLLHASVWHYLSNIVPLAVFSFLLMMHGTRRFVQVTSLAVIGTGAVVWLFAREAAHVGASGVIYAYFGYLLLAGLWQRSLKIAAISLFIG